MRAFNLSFVFVVAVLASAAAWAESIDIGPKIGAAIPASFSVHDQSDAAKTFSEITGDKGVVIAFVRSAAWCPFCQAQLRDLQTVAEPLAKRGFSLVSISYDAPEVLAKFAAKHGISYQMLSDKGSVMIDAFDIRDPQYKEGSFAFGVPRPVIFIVDKTGVVRAKLAEEGYKTRPPVDAIVSAVDGTLMVK